jgi:two-component system, cell cycle response regulator DivK
MHVLIVDDDADTRELYAQYFRHCGLAAETATTGAEAVEKASTRRPSLIVMDLSMPGMDGWSAVRWLKSQRRTRVIPVIALTGHALVGDESEARKAGCDAYVPKPCLPHDLARPARPLLPAVARRLFKRDGHAARAPRTKSQGPGARS